MDESTLKRIIERALDDKLRKVNRRLDSLDIVAADVQHIKRKVDVIERHVQENTRLITDLQKHVPQ